MSAVHDETVTIMMLTEAIKSDWSTLPSAKKEDYCTYLAKCGFLIGLEDEEVHGYTSDLGSYRTVEDIRKLRKTI